MNYHDLSCNQQMSINYDLSINHHLILSAINVILDWELPDEAFTDAVSGQVKLMAGGCSD